MSFGLYRSKEVKVNFGTLKLEDMRADQFINIRHAEDSFDVITGSDGSITRFCTEETVVEVDYIVKRSSNDNARLSAIHNADRVASGGAGVAKFAIKDSQGASLLSSEFAWIKRMPDAGNSKDVGPDVTWTFQMQILPGQQIIGGNQL